MSKQVDERLEVFRASVEAFMSMPFRGPAIESDPFRYEFGGERVCIDDRAPKAAYFRFLRWPVESRKIASLGSCGSRTRSEISLRAVAFARCSDASILASNLELSISMSGGTVTATNEVQKMVAKAETGDEKCPIGLKLVSVDLTLTVDADCTDLSNSEIQELC